MPVGRVDLDAKHLAESNGIDVRVLEGTGAGGRVTALDVLDRLVLLQTEPVLPSELPLTKGPSEETRSQGIVLVVLACLALGLNLVIPVPVGFELLGRVLVASLSLLLAGAAGFVGWSFLRLRLTLGKEGLSLRWLGRERAVRWADLVASPAPPSPRSRLIAWHESSREPELDLLLTHRASGHRSPLELRVPVSLVEHPFVVRAAIRALAGGGHDD